MRTARSAVVGSAAIAAVLIGILIGFPLSAAKSATTPASGQPTAGHGAEGGVDPRAIERGKALFGQYCVTCHGADAKGDGIAGQNLPIKPQNLTEGRIVNALPDDPGQDRFFAMVRSFRAAAADGSLYAPHRPAHGDEERSWP